jgi:hypothetical protein
MDANIEGQATHVWRRLQSPEWNEWTSSLDIRFLTFRDVELDAASSDSVVWHFFQENGYYLLTSNRNEESEESLEAVIRRECTLTSLPVFTLPDADRVYSNAPFLDRVVEKLVDFLLYADNIRGAGRVYLP